MYEHAEAKVQTLGDLRAWIDRTRDLPGDTLLILRGDPEGNYHENLDEVFPMLYNLSNPYDVGEGLYDFPSEDTDEEDMPPEDAVMVLVLSP